LSKQTFSAVDGRIRLRRPEFHDPGVVQELSGRLRGLEGVTKVAGNAQAGSILIYYDARQMGLEDIKGKVARLSGTGAGGARPPIRKRARGRSLRATASTVTNLGMLASLGMTLTGRRRSHMRWGKTFLGLLAVHLFLYRKKLWRDVVKTIH